MSAASSPGAGSTLARLRPRPVTPTTIAASLVVRARRRLAREPMLAAADLARAETLLFGLDECCSTFTTPASPDLEALDRRTAEIPWEQHDGVVPLEQEMLSGHVEGALLALLVRLSGARRVLELGTFTGYSALAMAEALPEDGTVVASELDPAVAAMARESFAEAAAGSRIRVEVGAAGDTLARLADRGEQFDLVFVDADKTGYPGYVATLLDRGLLRVGGLLVLDNTLLQGSTYAGGASGVPPEATAAVVEVNRLVRDDPRLSQVVLPVRDGITLALREPDAAAGADGRP